MRSDTYDQNENQKSTGHREWKKERCQKPEMWMMSRVRERTKREIPPILNDGVGGDRLLLFHATNGTT